MRRAPSNTASSDIQCEKRSYLQESHANVVSTREVDTGAQIVAGLEGELAPAEAAREENRLPHSPDDVRIQFTDKTTLGSASILGIDQGAHLTTNQYNWLGTISYISFFVFEYPQNLALQRFPVGRWMSLNIFVWAIFHICQAACTNFAGLFVCRLFLGMCEGCITAGLVIVSSMFYTRNEQTLRIGYWFMMNGAAQITSGFVSFGSLHIKTTGFAPWKWLVVITGMVTLVVAAFFWFFFPDSPTNAWSLTPSERATAVMRLKENQTGVENKHFKKEQMIEALLDPKTWFFALFSALGNVPHSLSNQRQIIISSFGFTYLDTTLLGCVDGCIDIMSIWTGITLAVRFPNARAYVGAIYFIPVLIGVLMIEFLPWSNQIGLLFGIWLTDFNVPGFVICVSWLINTTAGHTKRVTTNAVMLSAHSIGNAAGPFMWKAQYKPRNRIPWIIIGVCYLTCPCLLLVLLWLLARENARRDAEPIDEEEDKFFIEKAGVQVKVDKAFMDMTDRQNRDFRYVL